MAQVPIGLVSHTRKVCSLYKKAVRSLADWHPNLINFRYEAVLMRERFEKNRNIKDMRKAKKLLLDGEEELFRTQHPVQKKFANSPGGVAYGREPLIPDSVLDFWHPMEKARYPKFFEKREQLKKEYAEMYFKKHPDMKQKGNH